MLDQFDKIGTFILVLKFIININKLIRLVVYTDK